MMLALVVFTAILFSPSPTPLDAAGSPDPGPPQPAPVQNLSSVLAGLSVLTANPECRPCAGAKLRRPVV